MVAIAAVVLTATGAAADSFALTVVAQTNNTITFSYPQQSGYGYLYSVNGQIVSRTNDAARTQVKFSKATSYEVATITKGTTGSYSNTPPPPAGPAAPTNVSVTSVTQTGMTVVWSAVTGATNYRIYRAGNQIGQGPGSSGGYADAWADSGLVCGTSYVYAVDAQNAEGDSPKTSVTGTTVACNQPPPPPPPGSTITASQCASQASVTNAVIDHVTVTGECRVTGDNVTIRNSTVQGVVTFTSTSNGSSLLDSSAQGFDIESADHTLIQGNTLDGRNTKEQNFVWSVTNPPDAVEGFIVRNNRITNFTSPGSTHSEGMYIGGYARDGLIEGNTFYRNGNTAHIFFSWCAPNDCDGTGGRYPGDPRDPRNMCVRNNDFQQTWAAYFQVVVRQENNSSFPPVSPNGHGIYTDDNIKIQPGQGHASTATDANILVQFQPGDNLWASGTC